MTLTELAREALRVQNACNLTGVVHGWSRAVSELRENLPDAGTAEINRHPINVLWADKCADLAGVPRLGPEAYSRAYSVVTKLAEDPCSS